jgi:hypothetical protein
MRDFDKWLSDSQTTWRTGNITTCELGTHNGVKRPWILPFTSWIEGLWPGIRKTLPEYIDSAHVEKHKGVHNLKSSWMLCANLYFPFKEQNGFELLAGFLRTHVSEKIRSVKMIELEYAEESPLDPKTLLGESSGGTRGANQTSPDIAFIVETEAGKGLVLTENKLTEHHFYPCSGRKAENGNPDLDRCMNWGTLSKDIKGQCWQTQWKNEKRENRIYWTHVQISDDGNKTLRRCPAATDGYQLFRQQALAEGIAASGKYDLVVSCVAFDARNENLIHCLHNTGVEDFTTGWKALFSGKAQFATWTHQQWVTWVREHDTGRQWSDWLSYVETRYGY